MFSFLYFLKILFILERGGRRERGRETLISCLLHAFNRGPGLQPRHVPWPELNQWPFALWDSTQPTKPYPSDLTVVLICIFLLINYDEHVLRYVSHLYIFFAEMCIWIFCSFGNYPILLCIMYKFFSQILEGEIRVHIIHG